MQPRIHYFETQQDIVEELFQRITKLSEQCCAEHGSFSIVLAGGSTPRALYQRLSTLQTDWQCWHIYFSDERCLPAHDPDRNDTMATEAWLAKVAIPDPQIHRVPAEANAKTAATAYAQMLQPVSRFDLVLLGLGEDGHTASLFPGDPQIAGSTELAIAVEDAPKPPPQRVSMSAQCLSRAGAVWFMVTGEGKREALQRWLAGDDLPVRLIKPAVGVDVFTDIDC